MTKRQLKTRLMEHLAYRSKPSAMSFNFIRSSNEERNQINKRSR